MKKIYLSAIFSLTCLISFSQVNATSVKVNNDANSNTATATKVNKAQSEAVNVMSSKPSPVITPSKRGQKPSSPQLERDNASKTRSQKP